MLEGFTENELANYANECREEYAKKLKNIWEKAFDGEIKGYDELDKALRDFDNDFFYRMDDYTDDFVDPLQRKSATASAMFGRQCLTRSLSQSGITGIMPIGRMREEDLSTVAETFSLPMESIPYGRSSKAENDILLIS